MKTVNKLFNWIKKEFIETAKNAGSAGQSVRY